MMEDERIDVSTDQGELFRLLPSVNDLLLSPDFGDVLRAHHRDAVVCTAREVLDKVRSEIALGVYTRASLAQCLGGLSALVAARLHARTKYSLRRVINATGVLLHTNLGRAPLSPSALDHIVEIGRGYSNLELNLETGERSRRDQHVESLLLQVLAAKTGVAFADVAGSHGAIVVNNCAAATFLALNTLAEGREVLISRGELIEIGGGFRIPEILEKSGALLREVGATNRTKLADYEHALTPGTGLILRVHQSNFSMAGFTERAALKDLVALAATHGVPVFEDQGTGLLCSLEEFGVQGEPTLPDSLRLGIDLVAASGDKLLGGPQCGLLIGKRQHIERMRQNPLLRTVRVDKLIYAALEATLMDYLAETPERIPLLHMLRFTPEELLTRCEFVAGRIISRELAIEVVPVMSLIGGGTAPDARLQSFALSLRHAILAPSGLLRALRTLNPPVIGRISDDRALLDLRTVEPGLDAEIITLLSRDLA